MRVTVQNKVACFYGPQCSVLLALTVLCTMTLIDNVHCSMVKSAMKSKGNVMVNLVMEL